MKVGKRLCPMCKHQLRLSPAVVRSKDEDGKTQLICFDCALFLDDATHGEYMKRVLENTDDAKVIAQRIYDRSHRYRLPAPKKSKYGAN